MRRQQLVPCLLLFAGLAGAQQAQPEPDACAVTGNAIESKFFKFQYSFPQGWSAVNDDLRTTENRKRHEEEVKKELAKQPPDTPNSKHTTRVFWSYDLLIATPKPLPSGDQPGLTYIRVWARERFTMLDEAGDNAKMLMRLSIGKVLRQPEEVTISGRKFVRSDFVYHGNDYEALFITVSGNYQLGFEIRGTSEKEINDLAETMQTLKFF